MQFARRLTLTALAAGALAASGCSIDLGSLLNGGDDWLDASDSCNDHPRHHSAPSRAPADPAVAFPPNTR